MTTDNIHPEFSRMLNREDKEDLLKQSAKVFWLYGLSGSGKSTLANALERKLSEKGYYTVLLDGDNIRSGLNKGLGFSDEDRLENIRRIAEVAKLFMNNGAIVITSFITPTCNLRELAKSTIGEADFSEIYIKCSFEKCEDRDVKGLYAKAKKGEIPQFTGKGSSFEEPQTTDLTVDTEQESIEKSLEILSEFVYPKIGKQ